LILIWKTQSQSVNRRLTGTVPIIAEAEEYASVVQLATQKADYCECSQVLLFICAWFLYSQTLASVEPSGMMECEVRNFSLRFILAVPNGIPDTECQWLLNNMFPALFKWLRFIDPKRVIRKTNALLDIESYSIRYRKLKENYGRQLVETWTEKTDPKKFVYEDCGIAAYLLVCLKRGRTPKKIADIGCGNGLLVYLLNKEGVGGVGVDIRRRKIWLELLRDTTLIEEVVDPSKVFLTLIEDVALPEGVDYLIGNHTDELTPWMPVMAARINCDFFVLPCCPFNFHGKYTARPGDRGSQYNAFLGFIREVR
ncbi:unnamed protein product, partial [Haemonchus placei]|uniref:tRNA (uracil-O(2)-)-methyltransferase n=1 Tax=Haemonchus placei TaxID=6290 RepID=A0A0N4W550_HAEPC